MNRRRSLSSKSEPFRSETDKSEDDQPPQDEIPLQEGVNLRLGQPPPSEQNENENQGADAAHDQFPVADQQSNNIAGSQSASAPAPVPAVVSAPAPAPAPATSQPGFGGSLPPYAALGPSTPAYSQMPPSPETNEQKSTRIAVCIAISFAILVVSIALSHKWVYKHEASAVNDTAGWDTEMQNNAKNVYIQCYYGCGKSTTELDCSFNACQRTSRIQVNDTICDANKIWTWKDKYPQACLKSLGEEFRDKSLEDLKKGYGHQYKWIGIGVIGILLTWVIAECWRRVLVKRAHRAALIAQGIAPQRTRWSCPKLFVWSTLIALMLCASPVDAFHCWHKSRKVDRFFSNKNGLSGSIHGWTSNCTLDFYPCKSDCSFRTNPHGDRNYTCVERQCNRTMETFQPLDYVNLLIPNVEDCGFLMDEATFGQHEDVRIANPLLEMNKLVTIKVNHLNTSGVTDPAVMCLWEIGNL